MNEDMKFNAEMKEIIKDIAAKSYCKEDIESIQAVRFIRSEEGNKALYAVTMGERVGRRGNHYEYTVMTGHIVSGQRFELGGEESWVLVTESLSEALDFMERYSF